MRRRDLVILLGGAAVAWPLSAPAQPAGKIARIGFLSPQQVPHDIDSVFGSFLRGLRDRGDVEGQTVALEYRFAEGQVRSLPDLAAELVGLKVEAIIARGAPAIHAAAGATTTIPIVMMFSSGDPVRAGFVTSLARPGGNITGLTLLAPDLGVKRLELIKAAFPGIAGVAVLANPQTSSEQLEQLRLAAPSLRIRLAVAEAQEPAELDAAFSTMMKDDPQVLLVLTDPMLNAQQDRIANVAGRNRLPLISDFKTTAEAGGLIAYGPKLAVLFDRTAYYVARILKGADPAELPVEQPTEFELVINLKTAKALGLTIPPTLLARADEVIE
jgi:putative tryptophan/tyrosine transport system substrate-binding protein